MIGRARKGGVAAFGFLAVTGFVNALGVGLVIPVLPALLMELTGEGVANAALWGGMATFLYAVMQFLFSPIIGGLSDRFGRRPVLLVSLTAFAVDNVILGLASSLWMFFAARTLAGVFAATFSTCNAYVADVTPPEQRGTRFAVLGASFGAGFVFGPALGGLLGDFDPRMPFFAAAALAFLNALYGYLIIPESLRPERRRAFSWARSNPLGTLASLLRTPGVGRLLPVFFLATLSTWVYVTVWSYVAIAKFGWSEGQIGWSVAYYGVISFLGQAVVVQKVLPRIGASRALVMALLVEAVSLTGIGFAPHGAVLYAMITLAVVSVMQDPALRQELSARVPPDAQGELQGGLAALAGVAIVLAPLLYNTLFNLFSRADAPLRFPGAPFLAAAGLSLLAALVYLRIRPAPEPPGRPGS